MISRLRSLWKNYNLSITLAGLFLTSWFGQLVFQWFQYRSEMEMHGQPLQGLDFFNQFMVGTLQNWQSEFLQLFTFVILTSFLIHRGSHESKDTDEEMQASLDRLGNEVAELRRSVELSGDRGNS